MALPSFPMEENLGLKPSSPLVVSKKKCYIDLGMGVRCGYVSECWITFHRFRASNNNSFAMLCQEPCSSTDID